MRTANTLNKKEKLAENAAQGRAHAEQAQGPGFNPWQTQKESETQPLRWATEIDGNCKYWGKYYKREMKQATVEWGTSGQRGKQRTFPGALASKDSREMCAVPKESTRGYWIPMELGWQAAVSCLFDRVLGTKFRSF